MLVSAAVITALVVAVTTAWRVVRSDDETASTVPAAWDAIAFVATTRGDVTIVDPDGEVVARQAGDGRVVDVHAAGARLALVQSDRVTLLDVAAGAEVEATVVELDRSARLVAPLATARGRLLLGAGNRNGGPIRVIDVDTGAVYDLDQLAELSAPRLYTGTLRADPEGATLAVADAASFQTIVVAGLGATGDPVVENYAAQPLAVGQGLLATTQVVGRRADVSVHRLGAAPSAPVAMGIPAGGTIAEGRLLAVTTDGAVVAVRVGDRQPRQLTQLELPPDAVVSAAYPAAAGTRLVVHAGTYLAVLDTDGKLLFELDAPAAASAFPIATAAPGSPMPSNQPQSSSPDSTPDTAASTARDVPPTSSPSGPRATPAATPAAAPGTTPATTPAAGTPVEPAAPLVPAWDWTCLPVAVGTAEAALIALADGSRMADLDGIVVTDTSADGCVVLGTAGDRTVVAGAAGRAELGTSRAARLSPDGALVVRRDDNRVTQLIALDDELQPGRPIDVSAAMPGPAYSVAFVER